MSFDALSSTRLRALDVNQTSGDKPSRAVVNLDPQTRSPSSVVSVVRAGTEESLKKAETFSRKAQSTNTSSLHELQAIATYESVEKDQQRQNIQLLLGVDTFA